MTDPDDAERGVLAPEELELDREKVTQIDDNRYLIDTRDDDSDGVDDSGSPAPSTERRMAEDPSVSDSLAGRPEQYVLDVAMKTEHGIDRTEIASNDIRQVFEETMEWYTGMIEPDLDTEEVLEVMFSSSDLDV